MGLPQPLIDTAREHIQPAPEDDAAFMAALESAVAMAESSLSMSLIGRQREEIFHAGGTGMRIDRRFYWHGAGGSVHILLPERFTGPADVYAMRDGGWQRIGRMLAVNGVIMLDHATACECGCNASDGGIVKVEWRTDGTQWPWPAHVMQGIVRLAKYLYELRGDDAGGDPVIKSGAAAIWRQAIGADA